MKTQLTFFSELRAEELKKLFEDRFVFDDLKTLHAGISLGILDLSPERASVVQKLNRMGIPLTAWLLLPEEQGYWFNLGNHAEATARYQAFKTWSEENELEWAAVGLDIESDINEMKNFTDERGAVIQKALKRLRDTKGYHTAKKAYEVLVAQIHADGYLVEGYHFPLIVDDREAGSSVLQRVAGLVEIPVDREVLMLYSSFFRPHGHSILWSYAQEAQAIGIGNTGGGVQAGALENVPYLSWDEFATDLRLARRSGKPIYVFSLEGCVNQGFLPRLVTFDWQAEVELPRTALVSAGRGGLKGLLWAIERPVVLLAGLAGVIGTVLMIKSHGKSKKNSN
jgi:hypothetical protein